jgi:hypothetical protein
MNEAEQIRSEVLDTLDRLKAAHHALADGQNGAALVHVDVALVQLGEARRRLAPLACRVPVQRDPLSS